MNDNVDINDSIDNNNICDYGSKNKKTSRTRIFFPNKYIYSLNKYDFGLEKNILFSNTIFFSLNEDLVQEYFFPNTTKRNTWSRRGSNPRPSAHKTNALTNWATGPCTTLTPHSKSNQIRDLRLLEANNASIITSGILAFLTKNKFLKLRLIHLFILWFFFVTAVTLYTFIHSMIFFLTKTDKIPIIFYYFSENHTK
jgi:hypothetical protein